MKNFEIKNTEADSVKDVDTTGRRVKVAISKMGNLDLDNDVIAKTAYNKTIKERGPKGVNLIWHLTDHNPSLKSAIAKFQDLFVENDYLIGVTDIPKTTWGNDMLEMYMTKNINQHSVGFRTLKSDPVDAGKSTEHRLIKEIFLYEGSAVLWGANPETPTLDKTLDKAEKEKKYFTVLSEVNNLAKLFKSGNISDETLELLELQLAQKTNILQQLYEEATQPADNAVEPEQSEKMLGAITAFNNSLILQNHGRKISSGVS